MWRRQLAVGLAAASLALPAGCASGGVKELLTKSGIGDKTEENELSPEFRRAQKMFKDTERTMLAWARYQEDLGEYAEARKKYRELLIAYPDCTDASLGLARIERQTGRWAQSEEILLALEKKEPRNRHVKLEVGRLYASREDWPQAIAAFQRAAELDPTDQECRYELGITLARSGQFETAIEHLTFAVGEPAALYNIGYILHEQGRNAEAIDWFRQALQSHPDARTAERTKSLLAALLENQRPGGLHGRLASSRSVSPMERRDKAPSRPEVSAADKFRPEVTAPQSPDNAVVQRLPEISDGWPARQTLPAVHDIGTTPEPSASGSRRTAVPVSWSRDVGRAEVESRLPPAANSAAGAENTTFEPPPWRKRQR